VPDIGDHVCTQCGRPLVLDQKDFDREIRCPKCRSSVTILSEGGAQSELIKIDGIRASSLIRCTLCANYIHKEDKYCPFCGVFLKSFHTHEPLLAGSGALPAEIAEPIKTGAKFLVVGGLALLLIFAVVWFYYQYELKRLNQPLPSTRNQQRLLAAKIRAEEKERQLEAPASQKAPEAPPAQPAPQEKPKEIAAPAEVQPKPATVPAPAPEAPATRPAPAEAVVPPKPQEQPATSGLMDFVRSYILACVKGDRSQLLGFLTVEAQALAEQEKALPVSPLRMAGSVPYWDRFVGHKLVAIEDFPRQYSVIDRISEGALAVEVLGIESPAPDRAVVTISHPEPVRVEKQGAPAGMYRDVYVLPVLRVNGAWRLDLRNYYEIEALTLKQRQAAAIGRGPLTIKVDSDELWVGSVPPGAMVYVGPLDSTRKVRDLNYGFMIERLFQGKAYFKGVTPLALKLPEGRSRVAVVLKGTPQDKVFLYTPTGYRESGEEIYNRPGPRNPLDWDGGEIRLIANRGEAVMIGKVYEVAKEEGKPAILMAFLKRSSESYKALLDGLPTEISFAPPAEKLAGVLGEWQGGILLPELRQVTEILSRGGVFAYTGPDSRALVIRMVGFDQMSVETLAPE